MAPLYLMCVRRCSRMMEDLSTFVSLDSASSVHRVGSSSATDSVSPHIDSSLLYPVVLKPSLLVSCSFSGVTVVGVLLDRLLIALMSSVVIDGNACVCVIGDVVFCGVVIVLDVVGKSCCSLRIPHVATSGCAFFMKMVLSRFTCSSLAMGLTRVLRM